MSEYSVPLHKFIADLQLEPHYLPDNSDELTITTHEVDRAGLLLSGYTEHVQPARVQVCGMVEMSYLGNLAPDVRAERIELLLGLRPPAIVITRGNEVFPEMDECARRLEIPLLKTKSETSRFLSASILYLNVELAPRVTRHGVMVEVYGEGLFILGDSGIGKSETAMELIKRGHRLIADDAVELRKTSNRTIVATSPENIRHFMELRGIGVINVMRIFGMGSVKVSERVDMVINLEHWVAGKNYSRIGDDEDQMTDIMGVPVPEITIPVQPGRNLAIIIEVAAMNNRLKKMGHNSAHELMQRLGLQPE